MQWTEQTGRPGQPDQGVWPTELSGRVSLAAGLMMISMLFGAMATILATGDFAREAVRDAGDPAMRRAAGLAQPPEEAPSQGGLLSWLTPAPQERFTVLVLGSDRRPENVSGNSDTMVLATLDPVGKTIGLLSIPRDLYVPIRLPNGAVQTTRINAAHGYGGAPLAKATVESLFGVRIHRTLMVDMAAFPRIVDLLGGVEVNPDRPLAETFLPKGAGGPRVPVQFPAGPQHLNGEQALYYVRMRHVDSDIGRMERQQEVLLGLQHQAMHLEMLPRLPELWKEFQSALKTDLTFGDLAGLAPVALSVPREQITHAVIGWNHVRATQTEQGWRVLEPVWPAIRAEVARVFYDIHARAAVGKVQVVNRSGVPGLGEQAARALRRQGITQVAVRDEEEVEETTTAVRTGAGLRGAAAQQVARVLGLRVAQDPDAGDALTVVLGKGARIAGADK